MSKAITREQAIQGIMTLATKVDWDKVPSEALQRLIEDRDGQTGSQFTTFLKNGGKVITHDPKILKIDPKKKFDPTKFISTEWTTWKGPKDGDGLSGEEEIDERSLALTTLDITKMILMTCLKHGESSIAGEEKLARLKETFEQMVRLGGNVFLALWEDYQANGENSCLEWLRKNLGVTYLDFFGLVLRDPYGNRCVLYLYWYGGQWHWSNDWLDDGWLARRVSACLAS